MAEFSAGHVTYDPQALEQERSRMRAPLDWAALLAGPGALAARGARAAIAPGAQAAMRRQAMLNALRGKGKEDIAERMFGP